MMTAAVRDLRRAWGDRYLVDVRTAARELWENNPYLTPVDDDVDDLVEIHMEYPLIHRSNELPYHFIHGFRMFLEDRLRVRIPAGPFRGDVHLTDAEREVPPALRRASGDPRPIWLVAAGGKYDFTAKWWPPSSFQQVIDRLRDEVCFVQVGSHEHFHPDLEGVIDLRGRTPLREFLSLVHWSDGVLCPVTFLMHLAAAVPTRDGGLRPCVVVAGGREPPHWEAYPGHHFLHTIGALDCCATGGCWKSRTEALGDGSELDHPDALCLRPSRGYPECMTLIDPDTVAGHIRMCLRDKRTHAAQASAAETQ